MSGEHCLIFQMMLDCDLKLFAQVHDVSDWEEVQHKQLSTINDCT